MTLKIYERFAPRANPADGDYPYGSIKNESVPGAKDGTPLDAEWGNDYAGFDAALLGEAGIIPSGQPDKLGSSQRIDALHALFDTYTTVAEIATGKFQVGQTVIITDRANAVADIVTQTTAPNGIDILPAGTSKTANIKVIGNQIPVEQYGFSLSNADNAPILQRCVDLANPTRLEVVLPVSDQRFKCSKVTYYTGTTIIGGGQFDSMLEMPAGANMDLLYSEGADELWGTGSEGGVKHVTLKDISLWGNRFDATHNPTGNTSGTGLKFYGRSNHFENVGVYSFADENIRTEWSVGVNLDEGLEGKFIGIEAAYSGKEVWRFAGPHDSHCYDIRLNSGSQKGTGLYKNLWIEKGNARWSMLHSYALPVNEYGEDNISVRPSHSVYIQGGTGVAEGNEFSLSHFEGCDVNIYIGANETIICDGCRAYYPWNGVNVILVGSSCKISIALREEYKGIGLPLAKGLILGGTYGGVSNSVIDLYGSGMEAGWIDFGGSNGSNSITVRGFNATVGNTAYLAQPNATDDVDLYISGPNLVSLKYETFQTRNAVEYSVSATGSTQATAAPLDISRRHLRVGDSSLGNGIKFPNSALAGNGFSQDILNDTLVNLNFYPNEGGDLIGKGVNNPVVMPPLSLLRATVINADAGKIMWSLFTQ